MTNFQKIKRHEFGENLKKEYSSTHPSHVLSYIHLLYLWEQPRFIQKRMACQPRRDIYGRRHASSRVLTAKAGRMASPPSSNVIRRTNGPGPILQEIRRLSVTIRSGEFDRPCGDLARRRSDLEGEGRLLVDFCRSDARVMGHWATRNVGETLVQCY